MPHDVNGKEVKVGDRVTLVGTVTQVSSNETACNCAVKIDAPEGEYSPSLSAINTRSLKIQ